MKTTKQIVGILLIIFSSIVLLICLFLITIAKVNAEVIQYTIYSIIGLIIGIILVATVSEQERKEFNEYKRFKYQQMQQQYNIPRYTEEEKQIYFRYANAQGKPITEYQMDERTKLITYYDRMPYNYKKKLADYADTLYRRYENEEYLKK